MTVAYLASKKRSMLTRWEKHEGMSAKQEEDRRRWERTVVNKSGTRVSVIDLSRTRISQAEKGLDEIRWSEIR